MTSVVGLLPLRGSSGPVRPIDGLARSEKSAMPDASLDKTDSPALPVTAAPT